MRGLQARPAPSRSESQDRGFCCFVSPLWSGRCQHLGLNLIMTVYFLTFSGLPTSLELQFSPLWVGRWKGLHLESEWGVCRSTTHSIWQIVDAQWVWTSVHMTSACFLPPCGGWSLVPCAPWDMAACPKWALKPCLSLLSHFLGLPCHLLPSSFRSQAPFR